MLTDADVRAIELPGGAAAPEGPPRVDVTRLDLGDDIVFVTDPDGTIIDVNEAFVRITGYARGEAIGSSPRLLSSGHQDEAFYEQLWRTIKSGQMWQGQLVDRHRSGVLRTHHVTITPVTDAAGRISHFLAIERDVSGERASQDAMGTIGLVHTDPVGRCVYASDRAAGMLGRSPSEILGPGFTDVLLSEDADAFREVISLSIDMGRQYRVDVRTRDDAWLSIEVAPLTIGAGGVIGATCALEDVGREMAARADLRRLEALMTSVLDSIPEPVAVVDTVGVVVAVNAAWGRCRDGTAAGAAIVAAGIGDDVLAMTRRAALAGDALAGSLDEALRRALRRGGTHRRLDGVSITPLTWDEGGAILRLDV